MPDFQRIILTIKKKKALPHTQTPNIHITPQACRILSKPDFHHVKLPTCNDLNPVMPQSFPHADNAIKVAFVVHIGYRPVDKFNCFTGVSADYC